MSYFKDALYKYAVFSGRTGRRAFWMYILWIVIIGLICGIADAVIFNGKMIFMAVFDLAVLIPTIAISVRRLHDRGHSGWWYLLSFIPLIGSIILLIQYAMPGQEGSNIYGDAPNEG